MNLRRIRTLGVGLLLLLGLAGVRPQRAEAWGREGHHVVARIAARHLTQKTQNAIAPLLAADADDREMCKQQATLEDKLACVSVWADLARRDPQFASTAGLHFVNIPVFAPAAQRKYDAARDCAKGNCVVGGIDRYRAVLADATKPAAERANALKFLVHFIGDLHQPLHTAMAHDLDALNSENHGQFKDNGDRGGNLKFVTWFGVAGNAFGCWNLHAIWDDGIFEHSQMNEADLANALDSALTPQKLTTLGKGTPIDWVNESFGLAVTKAYKLPVRQTADKVCEVQAAGATGKTCTQFSPEACGTSETHYRYHLADAYFKQGLPAVKTQLTAAGVRLAKFLNDLFDPAS